VGNANLCTIVPDLQLKMGYACVPPARLAELTELAHYVAEVANLPPDSHQPFVGSSAFAHKGGIHVAAMRKNEASYQHVDPALVGNRRRTVISELAGRGNVLDKASEYGLDVNSAQAQAVLAEVKALEATGFSFESAEASLALMLRRLQPGYEPPFVLLDYTVFVHQRPEHDSLADARSRSPSAARCCTPLPPATARSTPSTARCARRCSASTPTLPRPPARLQGAHPRQRERHRRPGARLD
jgi:2-isopropylmalate synthase